jgi:hypothetical protein
MVAMLAAHYRYNERRFRHAFQDEAAMQPINPVLSRRGYNRELRGRWQVD